MAADAIRGYVESLAKEGLPILDDTAPEPIKEKVTVVLQDGAPGTTTARYG